MQAMAMRKDTRAWKAQVWISFLVAALLCAIGLAWLPGRELDRAFMVMGYVFRTTAAFALAKFVRDNERRPVDTPLWRFIVWGGFFVAMALTGWVLAAAGEAIAFVPNALGRALLYNERITR